MTQRVHLAFLRFLRVGLPHFLPFLRPAELELDGEAHRRGLAEAVGDLGADGRLAFFLALTEAPDGSGREGRPGEPEGAQGRA